MHHHAGRSHTEWQTRGEFFASPVLSCQFLPIVGMDVVESASVSMHVLVRSAEKVWLLNRVLVCIVRVLICVGSSCECNTY